MRKRRVCGLHHGDLSATDERRVLDDVRELGRDPEEEPQRSHGAIENRYMPAVLRQTQLKASDILEASRVGRLAEESSKTLTVRM